MGNFFIADHNKAKQHQSLRSLDRLALAPFVHGFAIIAQKHNHKSAVVGDVKSISKSGTKMNLRKFSLVFFLALMSACGGGESGGSSGEPEREKPFRASSVLLTSADNGATISATYDNEHALDVVDGDISEATYWVGNITGDSLEIDFGKVVHLSDITIYASNVFTGRNDIWVVELSDDQVNWTRTFVSGGGNPDYLYCNAAAFIPAENKMVCNYDVISERNDSANCYYADIEGVQSRYMRIRITESDASEIPHIKIYEVEVRGSNVLTGIDGMSYCDG